MVSALGILVAVPCQHRIVEQGEATDRLQRLATRCSKLALLPMAGGIGCDVFVATVRSYGIAIGAAVSIAAFALAMSAWYGLGVVLRRHFGLESSGQRMQNHPTPLHAKIEQMLTEARVILPGAQALLGFQLIVMMTRAFDRLPPAIRVTHLAALACITLTVILLISPAAIHRISFGGSDDPRLHTVGSVLITLALLPLATGISCDLFVAMTRLIGEGTAALAVAFAAFALLIGLWFLLPVTLRPRVRRAVGTR
jgi:hypothetical protein